MLVVLLVGGLVVVLVAFGFGTVYARRALVPIRESLANQRAALRRQREFAADASHELRTPLTVIRSSVEHLERHRDEPVATVGSALEDIDDEVRHMTAIVEDLLLLARSDSGAVALEHVPVDLGDVAADGASAMGKPATDRGVRVEVDPQPAVVAGDPARLRQLVMILVDNAIRHSPADGRVGVAVRADGERRLARSSRTTARGSGRRTCRTCSSASTARRARPGGGTGPRPRDRGLDRRPPRRPDRRSPTGPRAAPASWSACRRRVGSRLTKLRASLDVRADWRHAVADRRAGRRARIVGGAVTVWAGLRLATTSLLVGLPLVAIGAVTVVLVVRLMLGRLPPGWHDATGDLSGPYSTTHLGRLGVPIACPGVICITAGGRGGEGWGGGGGGGGVWWGGLVVGVSARGAGAGGAIDPRISPRGPGSDPSRRSRPSDRRR